MNITPLIDIIIPNYNKAKYIKECLESVMSQTYKNWNIYLIDDDSNDDSKSILKEYEKIDNIKLIYLEKTYGPHYCRNVGMENSTADYVAFLDSDDYWPKEKLKKQIEEMLKNNLDFTYTDISYFKNNPLIQKKIILPSFYNFNNFILKSTMSTSSIVLNKKILKDIKFKDVKHEDYLFKCEILKTKITAVKVSNTFTFYRMTNQNRSSNKIKNLKNLWHINKQYNNLNLVENLRSTFFIILNSLKNYGWK